MSLTIETLLGLVGVFLGASALVVAFLLHIYRGDKQRALIEAHLSTFLQKSEETLQLSRRILAEADQLTSAQQIRPELSTYLSNQWKFIEKTFHNRYEKHDICRRIVANSINAGDAILLDSGSSIDLVTSELLTSPLEDVHVYSNNVFAAIHLVGTTKVTFTLFAGEFSDRFAATYSPEFNNRIRDLPIRVFIMAATAFRCELGIMVNKNDRDNADFKAAALEAFSRGKTSRLVIAVDATKFVEPTGQHQPVIKPDDWQALVDKHSSRVTVVTAPMRPEIGAEHAHKFELELNKLRDARVTVNIGDAYRELQQPTAQGAVP